MSIGLTDILAALGNFPLLEDSSLLGGFRTVVDIPARNALDATVRKAGMFVWVDSDSALWRLESGLTNGDWVEVVIGGTVASLQDAYDGGETIVVPDLVSPVAISVAGSGGQLVSLQDANGITVLNAAGVMSDQAYVVSTANETTIGVSAQRIELDAGFGADGDGGTLSGSGGDIVIVAGDAGVDGGAGSGTGGNLNLYAGYPFGQLNLETGASGELSINTGGADAGTGNPGGIINVSTGIGSNASGGFPAGDGGPVNVYTRRGGNGDSSFPAGNGGAISLETGNGGTEGNGGGGGQSGLIVLRTGDGSAADNGGVPGLAGSITLRVGDSGQGNGFVPGAEGGLIELLAGAAGNGGTGGGIGGRIDLFAGQGGQADTSSSGSGGSVNLIAGTGGDGAATVTSGDGGHIDLIPGAYGIDGGGGTGVPGAIRLRPVTGTPSTLQLYDADESNYTGIKAANVTTSSVTYTLPVADGSDGSALVTNGSGQLSWVLPSVVGDQVVNATIQTFDDTPTVIHSFDSDNVEDRAVVAYDLTVVSIGDGGGVSNFRISAIFERSTSTVTEKDITYMNGPFKDDVTFDAYFTISGTVINLVVVGASLARKWKVTGYVVTESGTWV
jgi:hypothetical protein